MHSVLVMSSASRRSVPMRDADDADDADDAPNSKSGYTKHAFQNLCKQKSITYHAPPSCPPRPARHTASPSLSLPVSLSLLSLSLSPEA